MRFRQGDIVRVKPGKCDHLHANRQGRVNRIEPQLPNGVTAVTGGQPLADRVNALFGGTDLYEVVLESADDEQGAAWYDEEQLEMARQD